MAYEVSNDSAPSTASGHLPPSGVEPGLPQLPKGRRRNARARLGLPARLSSLDGEGPCDLVDVSFTGAKVSMRNPPRAGRDAVIQCEDLDAFGTVAWSSGDFCGVHFDDRLPREVVLALRALSENLPQRKRAELRRAAQNWVHGTVNDDGARRPIGNLRGGHFI